MTDLLITGATGFVGSHLVELLAERRLRVRALVRATSDTSLLERHGVAPVVGSLGDVESLRRAVGDAPVVLHLAAATRALSPAAFHRVNAVGTERLLDAMEADGGRRRMVYLSSLAAVGPDRGRPVRPEDEPRPLTAYGRSKLAGERAALDRAGVEVAVLRPPAVYGPRDRDLLTFFRLARWHVLPTTGAPDRPMQLVHARDLAGAVLAAAGSRATGVFHVAEPRQYPWAEVLRLVARAVGRRAVSLRVPGPLVRAAAAVSEGVARATRRPVIFDRDKARELLAPGWTCETESARLGLGFEATIALAEGLRETAAWYRAYGWL
ncbi:MAG: NAD-dependent epimerase/dehydratase family protein [Gemmatimonadota bacterium]